MSLQSTGSVRIAGRTLHIKNIAVSDDVTVDYVRGFTEADQADAVGNCVQLGARVLAYSSDRLGATEIAETIDASVTSVGKMLRAAGKSAHESIDQHMKSTFGKDGSVETMLDNQIKRFQRDLEKQMDPKIASSLLGAFHASMKTELVNSLGGMVAVFDPDRTGSVGNRILTQINSNHKEVAGQIEAVITQLAVKSAVTTERLRGPHKGRPFEDALEDTLTRWARHRHDSLDRLTDAGGLIPGCKKGDFVLTVNPREAGGSALRIAVEAKNDGSKHRESIRYLRQAIENRGATVGVFVSTNPDIVPKGTPPVCFLNADQIFVQVEHNPDYDLDGTIIEVAMEVARATAIQRRSEHNSTMDFAAMNARITAAINATTRFADLKRQLSGIASSVEKVQLLVDDIRGEIRKVLEELASEVARQSQSSPEHALKIA